MDFTIDHILAPVDLGDTSRPALRVARLLAERFGAGITALYVDESLTLETHDSQFSTSRGRPRDLVKERAAAPVAETDGSMGKNPARAIVRAARRGAADMIVMGTHSRRGVRRLLDGSVAEKVLRWSHCPVLVVPEISGNAAFGRILCAIDDSDASRRASLVAMEIAEQFGAELVLARTADARAPWMGSTGRLQWREVTLSPGADDVFRCARDVQADLLVVGSQQLPHNRKQLGAGLTAEELIQHSPCAVLDIVTAQPAAAQRAVSALVMVAV